MATLATMPTPEPEPHIGLDDVGIARGQRNLRTRPCARKQVISDEEPVKLKT